MKEINREIIIRAGLLGFALSGVAGVAPSSHEGLTSARSAYADGLPEKWSSDMTRLAPTQEIRDQGNFSAHLNRGEIMIITSRGVNALGNSIQVAENDPGAVAVTVVAAAESVDVPFGTLGKGIYAWVDLAKTSDTSFDGIVKAAVTAGEVKVGETKKTGQCGSETGCGSTHLVVAIAHKDPLNSSLVKYDSVRDRFYPEQQSPCDKIVVVGAACQPCAVAPAQPEVAPVVQVPEFPKNDIEAAKLFNGGSGTWIKNTDGGWFLKPAANNEEQMFVNPNGRIAEGYNDDGVFVAEGKTTFYVRGVTIWDNAGQEAATELYNKVKQNNPDKQVTLIP